MPIQVGPGRGQHQRSTRIERTIEEHAGCKLHGHRVSAWWLVVLRMDGGIDLGLRLRTRGSVNEDGVDGGGME